ncbi:MAG: nicotinate (nicotinamide) nucleotide adenylyltransferase [Bacteroidales bacterium]
MKKAYFFGSFNPIHYGHLAIIKYLLEKTDAEKVVLIVSPHNPLKDKETLSNASRRFHKVQTAISELSKNLSIKNIDASLEISDIEFHLPEPLYTSRTLNKIRESHPEDQQILIIGEDNLGIIEKWHDWQEILKNFEVWVYPRPGYNYASACRQYDSLPWTKGVLYLAEAPKNNISSTEIRKNNK